ncbi:hypothetical protein U6T11_12390, partial [Cutibacterium acnes]
MNTPALTSALIMAGLGLILAIDGLVPAPPRPGAPLSPAQRWARLTHRPTGAAGRRRGAAGGAHPETRGGGAADGGWGGVLVWG